MYCNVESIEILTILGLINHIQKYQKTYNHACRKQESRMYIQKIDEIGNYLIEGVNRNELMSKKYKKVCRVLSYIDHLVIVIFKITGCVSISAFASLVGIPIGITSSAIRIKTGVITAGIKKYKSIYIYM